MNLNRLFLGLFLILESVCVCAADASPNFNSSERIKYQKWALEQAKERYKNSEQDRLDLVQKRCPMYEDEYWATMKVWNPKLTDMEIRKQWAKTDMGRYCQHQGFKP